MTATRTRARLATCMIVLLQAAAIAPMCAAVMAGEEPPHLRFAHEFDTRGEPPALHFQARFVSRGVEHHLDVWRDGQRRLKRRTDDAIEIHATRTDGSDEFDLSVLDLRKHIHTRIERSNLYRIGSFTDWFDLAHGLRHPKGAYELVRSAVPEGAPAALAPCRWYSLSEGTRTTRICWSTSARLPLLMIDSSGSVQWQVTQLQTAALPKETFVIDDRGFVRNDANQDIAGD